MTIRPTVKLSAADRRRIDKAQKKAAAGDRDKITDAENASIDKARSVRDQEAFAGIAQRCPRQMFAQLLGVSVAALNKLAKRYEIDLNAVEIDLCAILPSILAKLDQIDSEATERGKTAICRTYRELADALQLSGRDPVRQLKDWHARGMPGKVGSAGRRDGRFVVDDCRTWIATNVDRVNSPGGESDDIRSQRRRLLSLDLEIKEAERLEQLGRLADVDEIAAFNTQCVNNAKSILEAWPDKAIERLPADLPEAITRGAFDAATTLVDDTLDELARIIDGDDDPTESDDEIET